MMRNFQTILIITALNGCVGVTSSNSGQMDLLWTLLSNTRCPVSWSIPLKLLASDGAEFVGIDLDDHLISIDSNSYVRGLMADFSIESPVSISIYNNNIFIIDDQGYRITLIDRTSHSIVRKVTSLQLDIVEGEGLSPPIPFISLFQSPSGSVYALSRSFNLIVILNNELFPITSYNFPSVAYPFRYMRNVSGIRGSDTGMFIVFSNKALNYYSFFNSFEEATDFSDYIPARLIPFIQTMANNSSSISAMIKYNPTYDVFNNPELKALIDAASNQ